ncbi:MAG: gamma-glutamyl-gamma-aminobutyrate hydrolase family protein [Proteobacteria bacterium]|nr:gamma-glutamyl-gamma-aminobutyrate hydrolase family protein [Pseudomonadota bacterium]
MSGYPHHTVTEECLIAVVQGAAGYPVIIPALGAGTNVHLLLTRLDGILLSGSLSNVAPDRYGGPTSAPGTIHDLERDGTTLPLITKAVAAGVPLLAICRGFQEMNVAFGGTLHQRVHEIAGFEDHRQEAGRSVEEQFGPAHEVILTSGGKLRRLIPRDRFIVNSLHAQGIDRLAPDLDVEASALDGLVEAISVRSAPTFAIGVQWHPEWRVLESEPSRALFAAFGSAARERSAQRR